MNQAVLLEDKPFMHSLNIGRLSNPKGLIKIGTHSVSRHT